MPDRHFQTRLQSNGAEVFRASGGRCTMRLGPDDRLSVDGDRWSAYRLCLSNRRQKIEIHLDALALARLYARCRKHTSAAMMRQTPSEPSTEKMLRDAAVLFFRLSGAQLQNLLRDTSSDDLILFLWRMRDEVLITRVLDRMAEKAAEYLLDDLIARFTGLTPEQAPFATRQSALAATERLLARAQIELAAPKRR